MRKVKLIVHETDAYGNGNTVTSSTHIANLNPLRYRGYYYDTETGFYYLQTRYYDPTTGRFLNADGFVSTGQGMTGYNMFAYCGNNPVNFIDLQGTSAAGISAGFFTAGASNSWNVAGWVLLGIGVTILVVSSYVDGSSALQILDEDNILDFPNISSGSNKIDKKDPISAMNGVESKNIANQYQQKLYPKTYTRDNNQANAFKHAMWNAVMTDKIGEEKAKIFADAHEKVYLQVTPTSCEMDLHNNALGRKIAIDYAGQGYDVFAAKIQEAIERGEAYVITWDEGN